MTDEQQPKVDLVWGKTEEILPDNERTKEIMKKREEEEA